MLKKSIWLSLVVALPLTFLFGCMDFGKVDQGRAVSFDKDKRTVTIIRDKRIDTQNPDYSYLPPLTYELPTDPVETGPEPKAGGRVKLDTEKNQIVIFDARTQNFKTIDFKVVEKKEGVRSGDPALQGKSFPVIDKSKQTITIYSGRQNVLETISVPEEYLSLPPSTWDAGDEVRIYYKQEGKALRFMNISRTDIFKK
ncbi:MAG: DUF4881 domain-containing protein [Deltaproteobacteria bacterium]|nr:DUF4881 domain-containing protein [Deltaproteobacteria bacterium]